MATAAVVSVSMGVMKPVLAKLATLMGDEYKKIKRLRKMVAFLQRELGDMDALLEKMDSADELDPQAKKWRRDIIEMSYNIEDRIDYFMHTFGEADGKMGILQKAAKSLRTFNDRRRQANAFQEIQALVIEASDRRKRYMLDQCISDTTPVVIDPRMSALYKESTSLVGIESQKDKLVSWVMDEVKQLKFMAIVGFGGIGKTTLANEVYREVGGNFECKAFVSVSLKPQLMGLLNSLLSQLGQKPYSHACQLQDLIHALRGHLQDKRYFIVVDDLWDVPVWDEIIKCAFPQSNHFSRVIITTRNENVASSCCHNHGYIHNMEHLSEQNSRKLFFGRIFGSEDACPNGLKKASTKILRKCGGLPLAIITMSSMLACQPRRLEGQWEYIQNSLDIKSATNYKYEDMMFILGLSYKNLPRHLKACFLYLGSYPEDHIIQRDELVRRWVAEGFVNSTGQDVWDVAESYFNELINRSMIQPTYNDKYIVGVSSCRVHDMLLDLIVRRCKEDNFLHLVTVNEPGAVAEVQHDVIRRLTVDVGLSGIQDEIKVTTTVGQNLSQIRSLTIHDENKYYRESHEKKESNWTPWLLEFKFLRVLSLDNYSDGIEIDITCINQLSQLRYLNVHGNFVLPCQIRGLRLLETLIFYVYSATSNIVLEIDNVPRLCHLSLGHHIRLCDGNIGKLALLRSLCGFILPTNSLEIIVGMEQLTALSELRIILPKGCTALEKVACMEALSTSLEKLGNLRKLSMSYAKVAWCADVLSSLSPTFRNLEHLHMEGCTTFSKVPRWIGHLQNLRSLGLSVKQMVEEDFAIIGTGAPSLLRLILQISGILTERIIIRGSMGFALVRYFKFNCDCVSYLSFEARAMPELRWLELVFDANEWDKAAPGGLQHLPRLKKIAAQRSYYGDTDEWNGYDKDKAEAELITGVFQKAADAVPTCPTFNFYGGWSCRPVEEDDCLNVLD